MFPLPLLAKAFAGLGIMACAACGNLTPRSGGVEASRTFYTVTGEIALSRHDARVAALEYAAAAENSRDAGLLARAAQVTAGARQPSLTWAVAARWIDVDAASLAAHRAAGQAALELFKIEQATAQYRFVLNASPRGAEAEFAILETELSASDDVHASRQLADRLADYFPVSPAALRLKAFAELRADDPAAAVRSFTAALAMPGAAADQEMRQALWRARILCHDATEPLMQARTAMEQDPSVANRLGYAVLLMAAQQAPSARAVLHQLTGEPAAAPAALRLLGLIEFEEGELDDAAARFAELVVTGEFLDDAFYYLGLIAERHHDLPRALRLYAQVQAGADSLPALLRAAALLRANGAAPAAHELLDRLVEDAPLRAPEILAARVRIDADAGELPQAMAALSRGLLQYPDSVELQYAAASLAEEQGDLAGALRELKGLLKRRPRDPAALNAYGYTLADHHRHLAHARVLIERAFMAAPKNAAILDSFGWLLFRQGRSAEALNYLSAAHTDDHGGDIAAHLGEVLWQLGRRIEAERIWDEASRAESDKKLLDATRTRLHAST